MTAVSIELQNLFIIRRIITTNLSPKNLKELFYESCGEFNPSQKYGARRISKCRSTNQPRQSRITNSRCVHVFSLRVTNRRPTPNLTKFYLSGLYCNTGSNNITWSKSNSFQASYSITRSTVRARICAKLGKI